MAEFDPDQLFRRYVQRRDVGALGELFDGAAPQLARVAWHLVHDAAEVEDLVQATFLTALDSAEKFDARRPVMPWLLGILANHARNARRAAVRRPDALASEVADPRVPEEELERRELSDAVRQAVANLPDTYREVVATWLLEGASPGEIAARTGKPGATVRVQLHRGLELLRQGLPAGVTALLASSGWSQGSAGTVRAVVLVRASEVARTLAPTSVLIGGGLLVATKLWFAAAAAITAAALVWIFSHDSAQPAPLASAPDIEARGSASLRVGNSSTSVVERSEVTVHEQVESSHVDDNGPAGWWLVGTVVGDVGSDTARVSVRPDEDWSFSVSGAHVEVDMTALFAEPSKAPRYLDVVYDHPRFMPEQVSVDVGSQTRLGADRVELRVTIGPTPARRIVTGQVLLPFGENAGAAFVALYPLDGAGRPGSAPTEATICRDDGAFRVRSPQAADHVLVAAHTGFRPASRSLAVEPVVVTDVGAIELEQGVHLAGSLTGLPAPGYASVSAVGNAQRLLIAPLTRRARSSEPRNSRLNPELMWLDGGAEFATTWSRYGDDGKFRIAGLAPIEYSVIDVAEDPPRAAGVGGLRTWSDSASVIVRAPMEDLALVNDRRQMRLDIRADARVVDRVTVRMSVGSDTTSCIVIGHSVELRWNGDDDAVVRVSIPDRDPVELTIRANDAVPGASRIVEL